MAKKLEIGTEKTIDLTVKKEKKNTHRQNGIALDVPLKRGRPKGSVTLKKEVPVVEKKRGRGRPRKIMTTVTSVAVTIPKKSVSVVDSPTLKRTRQKRIGNEQLLQADVGSGRVALAANRAVEQLQSMLDRADIQQFRGRKERPQLILSMLEQQVLQEALALFEMKVALQRGGQLRRSRVG